MAKNSLQISNSFTFNFLNTTQSVQTIRLFSEGTDSEFDVKNVFTTGQTTALNNNAPQLPTPSWNALAEYPFYFFGDPLATTIPYQPTSLTDIQLKDTGDIYLECNNGLGIPIIIPVTAGENMQIVNERINQYLRDFSTTDNFRSSSGQVMTLNLTFDFAIFNQYEAGYPIPIIQGLTGYTDPYGISVQYPLDFDTNAELSDIVFTGTPAPLKYTFIELCPLTISASANGVEVTDGSSVTYSEIKQSQNGGALDIDSLVVNVGSAPSDFEKQSQLLQPFRFKKIDVNGNEYEIQKVQTIDPYQYQYSFGKVDMTDDGENFVLDGNTRFVYSVEPNTSVNITYNYIQAKNSTFGQESGREEIDRDLKNIAELDDESSNERELVFSNFTQESNATQPTKNVSNKTNYFIPLLLGGIALYLLFNLKSNQK